MKPSLISHSEQSFCGYKINPKKTAEFMLKKKEFQLWDTLSFLTAVTSAAGFAIGGVGLLSDYFVKKTPEGGKKTAILNQNASLPEAFGVVNSTKKDSQINFSSEANSKKEGAKTIEPSTKFSKLALVFAKVGIAFSGIAGIFNGISMGLPLMAAGEALNVCASPIIETPLGTGLFGIALAAVFSGRALENDPVLKLDKMKLKEMQGFSNKAKYIWQNTVGCAKEVARSGKVIGNNITGLFKKSERNDAINFFKDNVFTIKPKKLIIKEMIDEKGLITIERGFKNSPYLMHGASMLLAAGGVILSLSSIIKNSTGQKVGLRTYEVGGSLDNLSLSRWGFEKAATAPVGDPTAKLAGYLLGASGLTILAGQPGVDEKWGRGTQWVGTALLFSVFAVERFPKAFKTLVSKPEFKNLVRQWEIDLTKVYSNTELKKKISPILKSIANNKEIEDKKVKAIFDNIEKILKQDKSGVGSKYIESTETVLNKIKEELEKTPELKCKVDSIFSPIGKAGNPREIMESLQKQSSKFFQS